MSDDDDNVPPWIAAVIVLGCIGVMLFALAVSGCAVVRGSSDRPADFPVLRTTAHFVSTVEMRDRCAEFAPPGTLVEACAAWNFIAGTCDIWIARDFVSWSVIAHELQHCAGVDHVGETTLRDAWRNWKESKR